LGAAGDPGWLQDFDDHRRRQHAPWSGRRSWASLAHEYRPRNRCSTRVSALARKSFAV